MSSGMGGDGESCACDTVDQSLSPVAVSTHNECAGNVPGPPVSVLITGDVANRLFAQAMDGF